MSFDFSKASQSFDSLPYKERIKSVLHLVKGTFTIIGKDDDIIKPWIRMAIYHSLMVTFGFGVFFLWQYEHIGYGLLSFFLGFLLFLYKHFYNNKQEMRLSWIVYETVIGNDPSYRGATMASKELKWHIRKIACIDILMIFVKKSKFVGGGIIKMLIRLFIAGLEEVWDLANHYLLPSVAVDKMDITPAVKEMKKLKDRVPESLVGIFGIDFLGRVVRHVTIPAYVILFVISAAIGYFASSAFPPSTITIGEDPVAFSWVPVIVALWIGKLFSNLFERTVTSVKVIYFTIFYTKITHPERIREDMQEELVDYLKLKQVDEVDNLDEQNVED
ncbi:hypothetical protein CK503_04910 [Aliifodinibius salipaludis]|uniref:Uncharacterized protein n=1 Tax=Fodinibius salipaludis TaxID=2032627 RepID=A0A2A2GCU7_9BACT|nr:hypothetical protein [Aliifodinibius salipaludis]PAU94814.1 hypothetical protein CK503_04910 [Aliifodinibius salipaludis]